MAPGHAEVSFLRGQGGTREVHPRDGDLFEIDEPALLVHLGARRQPDHSVRWLGRAGRLERHRGPRLETVVLPAVDLWLVDEHGGAVDVELARPYARVKTDIAARR